MKSVTRTFILLISIITLSGTIGCSSDSDEFDQSFQFDDEDSAKSSIKSLDLACESHSNCPEFIGGLAALTSTTGFFSTKYQLGVCSQSLISPTRVLTNRHCVPKALRHQGANCKSMVVYFPAVNGRPAKKVGCKSVVAISPYKTIDKVRVPDWAVLELEEAIADRAFPKIEKSGIPHLSEVNFYPVNYTRQELQQDGQKMKSLISGRIRKNECVSRMNSGMIGAYNHPQSPLVALTCSQDTIGGNSGSGLFNGSSSLVGVVSMAVNPEAAQKGTKFMGGRIYMNLRSAGGTNLHCISALNSSPSEACRFFEDNDFARETFNFAYSMSYGATTSPEIQQKIEETLRMDPTVQWEVHRAETFQTFRFENQEEVDLSRQSLTPFLADYLADVSRKSELPLSPSCIEASRKSEKDFKILLPQAPIQLNSLILSPDLRIDAKRGFAPIELQAQYDESLGVFQLRLSPVPENVQEFAKETSKNLMNAFVGCYAHDRSECENLNSLSQSFDDHHKELNVSAAIFNNAMLIRQEKQPEEKVIKVPVCK